VPDSLLPNAGRLGGSVCVAGRSRKSTERARAREKEREKTRVEGKERERKVDHTLSSESEARSARYEMMVNDLNETGNGSEKVNRTMTWTDGRTVGRNEREPSERGSPAGTEFVNNEGVGRKPMSAGTRCKI
jgi:hypothetical protein